MLIALLMQLQHLRVLIKSLAARQKLKLCSANYLRRNAKIKAPLRAKSEATTASLPTLFSAKIALGGRVKCLASSGEANATSEAVVTSSVVKPLKLD